MNAIIRIIKKNKIYALGIFLIFSLICFNPNFSLSQVDDTSTAKRLAQELGNNDDPEVVITESADNSLATQNFWRFFVIRETAQTIADGRIEFAPAPRYRIPTALPAKWMDTDFSDTDWARLRSPMFERSQDEEWKILLARGKFAVDAPAKVTSLELNLKFKGGIAVFLNGQEVCRHYLPSGAITTETLAEPYSREAYFSADNKILFPKTKGDDNLKRLAQRIRMIDKVSLPTKYLCKGINVIAIANIRAPTLQETYQKFHADTYWAKIGLSEINLVATPVDSVRGRYTLPANTLTIWNAPTVQRINAADLPELGATLKPLQIVGARNGSFSAQFIVSASQNINEIKIETSPFKGTGEIPANAIQLRYGLCDGSNDSFDSLEEQPPATIALHDKFKIAMAPVWVTVAIPPNAPSGDYRASLHVSAQGFPAQQVPLQLHVSDWQLPAPKDFTGCLDIVQSAESVAMAYDVPLWSEPHFKLLDKSFKLLGDLGNKTVFISAIRRTHFGNEHAIVRWIRDEEGELHPDFGVVERYLDAAMKHMGHIPGVILLCWEPPISDGHASGAGTAGRTYDKVILYSFYDAEDDSWMPRQGPAWATPEAQQFWQKISQGIKPVLAKRGLQGSLLFGLVGDTRPTKQAMDDITYGLKDPLWAVHSHYNVPVWNGYTMGMRIALWGLGYSLCDPGDGYGFGWSSPEWLSYFPREMSVRSLPSEYHSKMEAYIGAKRGKATIMTGRGARGLGRIGADFWPVYKGPGNARPVSLAGRYPESAWGQLNLNNGIPYIFGRGAQGPVATIRSEALREAQQEMEARIFIDKMFLDPRAESIVGAELVKQCRTALDERIRVLNRISSYRYQSEAEAWYISSGWLERTRLLFDLAAAVKNKYGEQNPQPEIAIVPKSEMLAN